MDDQQFTVNDGYRNFVANLGTSGDKTSSGHYVVQNLNDHDLINMYRGSWLAQKIVDIIPDDATRQWRNWNADKEEITKIEDEEKRLQLKEKMRAAIRSARLFGMAAIHIALEDDADDPQALENPLDPETVSAGGISHLTVIPRIALSAEEVSNDPLSEYFGRPEFYRIVSRKQNAENNLQVRIHASRLIVFYGKQMPEGALNIHSTIASDSVLQVCFDAIRDTDAITANVNSLVFESKIDVIKVKNLNRDITIPGYEAALLARFTLANRLKGTNSLLLLDGEEEFERKNASFGELSQIMDRYFQNVAGACDIPLTRLYGMAPAGLNATGESDLRNYYDRVKIMQELEIDPQMSVFNSCLKASALGDVRPDIFHEWRPLWQMTDKERVDIGKIVTEIASQLIGQNIIRPDAVSEATANALIEFGVMPGLEAAIDEFGGAIPEGPSIEQQIAMMGKSPQDPNADPNARPKPKLVVNNDMEPTPLYVRRDLLNTAEFKEWAKSQGIENVLDDLHVTITYSKTPVDWMKMGEAWEENLEIPAGGPRVISKFGEGAIVLEFVSSSLKWRHDRMIEEGASHDWPDYAPHVTITYSGENIDVSKIDPYKGRLIFGPEIFEPLDTEWKNKTLGNDAKPKKRMTREELEFWREYIESQGFDPDDPEFDPRKDPDIEIIETAADFNPNQPRDDRGRWTSGGSTAGGAPAPASSAATGRSYAAADEASYQDMARQAKASQGAAGLAVSIAEGADAYFVAGNGKSGFAMKGNDFIGVVNHKDNPERGVVGDMLKTAENYAREKGFTELTLDCFDAFLPKYYGKFGFEETERVSFDWDYAPEGWTKAHGEPDVVFMRKKL